MAWKDNIITAWRPLIISSNNAHRSCTHAQVGDMETRWHSCLWDRSVLEFTELHFMWFQIRLEGVYDFIVVICTFSQCLMDNYFNVYAHKPCDKYVKHVLLQLRPLGRVFVPFFYNWKIICKCTQSLID